MSMLSQKSDDGPHIAMKIQCNNTPNGSPQYTQVPLQDWAVFIYHRATICISVLCPISPLRSVTSEDSCNIPSCFHMALQGMYSCQHHCNVVWADTTDLPKCYIYLYYFWYHLVTSHLSRKQYYPNIVLYVSHYNWAPAKKSIHKE